MVTVIMPAYNCERFLEAAVESVIRQTYKDWKLLIIDDCSTDGTGTLAKRLADRDPRIMVLSNAQNLGVSRTRNRGIREAESEWIALLDSDDTWEAEKLERQMKLAEQDVDIVYCSYDLIDEEGKVTGRPCLVPPKTDFKAMLVSNVISCSTALIRTHVLQTHPFDPDVFHEDYLLWMELLRMRCKAVGDPEVLAHYRLVSGARNRQKGNAAKERWKIYRRHLHLGLAESLVSFIGYSIRGIMKYYF